MKKPKDYLENCECGESAVDLEEGYQRSMGKIKEIKRSESRY